MSIVVVVVPPPWHSFTPHVANASTVVVRRPERGRNIRLKPSWVVTVLVKGGPALFMLLCFYKGLLKPVTGFNTVDLAPFVSSCRRQRES